MRINAAVAASDLMEMILLEKFDGPGPVSLESEPSSSIPLWLLQRIEKFAADWKGQGFPREVMARYVGNPLIREVLEAGILHNLEEMDQLQEAYSEILDRYTRRVFLFAQYGLEPEIS